MLDQINQLYIVEWLPRKEVAKRLGFSENQFKRLLKKHKIIRKELIVCKNCKNKKVFSRGMCRSCYRKEPDIKKKDFEYSQRKEVKEKARIYSNKYRLTDHGKKRKTEYRKMKVYKEKTKIYQREYEKKRLKEDIQFKISHNLRCRFRIAIKQNKTSSVLDYLGCSINEFKQYLEKKFKGGMNWSNWGRTGWHIDHIRPLSLFDLTKESEKHIAFHYTNLQPLWAIDNLKKGNKEIQNEHTAFTTCIL